MAGFPGSPVITTPLEPRSIDANRSGDRVRLSGGDVVLCLVRHHVGVRSGRWCKGVSGQRGCHCSGPPVVDGCRVGAACVCGGISGQPGHCDALEPRSIDANGSRDRVCQAGGDVVLRLARHHVTVRSGGWCKGVSGQGWCYCPLTIRKPLLPRSRLGYPWSPALGNPAQRDARQA